MTGRRSFPFAGAFRRAALPLAAYYTVTLALPLANGAARSGAPFVEHALVVLVVPPAVVLLFWSVAKWAGRLRKKYRYRVGPG